MLKLSNGLGDQNEVHLYVGRLWIVPQNQQEGMETVERGATKKEQIQKKLSIFLLKMKFWILRCIHSLSPNNVNDQNKKAINEQHKNFHILEQIHFQKINKNISSVYSTLATAQQQISNVFFLKWVRDTATSKCYRCNGAIQTPLISKLDNHSVAEKDICHYRDRCTR